MAEFRWVDVTARQPGAYRAEAVVAKECRAEVVWRMDSGSEKPHHVRVLVTKEGFPLWAADRNFTRHNDAIRFFERMREQAEIRLNKLKCGD